MLQEQLAEAQRSVDAGSSAKEELQELKRQLSQQKQQQEDQAAEVTLHCHS